MRIPQAPNANVAIVLTAMLTAPAIATAANPPLPTPCLAGSCGTAAQSFVQYGTAGAALNGNTLNITQTSSKAVLNWANFNIANGYTVNFLQPSATAAVLNNIWSASPSVIAGKLNANGQVFLYNQNGIVFDKGGQVNVAGLTASTLPFAMVPGALDPDALFENGILSETVNGGSGSLPAVFVAPQSGAPGTVTVNSGATLTAADGGRILLLGSAVTNSGSISTPDGQTILAAAGKAAYLAASPDPDLRGLLIEVDDTGVTGTVINNGQITAARGNITLAGLVVNQAGMLSATTSVSANGSIYLVAGDTSAGADYFNANPSDSHNQATAFGGMLPNNGGTLLLTPGSVTQVSPDPTDTGTLNVTQQANFLPSQVELAGRVIGLEGNASIQAPGGAVNLYASANPYQFAANFFNLASSTLVDGSSVYLAPGSSIDVSGLANVAVPVTQNLLTVTLETNDLQNDPLLRSGFLHGQTVTVDIRHPPQLFDDTPYVQNIGSNVEQLLTKGGAVTVAATGDVITRAGSTVNVSGGDVAFQGGLGPSTTNLVASTGQVYNIANAPSNVQYVGVANNYAYTDPAWGVTSKGNGQSYYAGYTQGSSAGTLTIQAPDVYLRGSMLANTVNGPYQRLPGTLTPGGTLVLGCTCTNSVTPNFGLEGGVTFANNLPDDLIGNVAVDGYVVDALNLPAVSSVSGTQLAQSGFSTLNISSAGAVHLPGGSNLALAAGGSLIVNSETSIDIDSNVQVAGGQVSLKTVSTGDNLTHDITLGAGSAIDVSGNWTNDSASVTPQPGTAPVVLAGGDVSLSAAGNVVLGVDSRIDVSGGGWINQANQLSSGNAGAISAAANFKGATIGAVTLGAGAELLGGGLKAGEGGTLSLQSGSITVGNEIAGSAGELLLAPGFFEQGGFAQYNIVGQNDVIIGNPQGSAAAPINITPIEQTLLFTKNALLQPTGTSISSFTQLGVLPAPERAAASLSFSTTTSQPSLADIGDITLEPNAAITTDPGARVSLTASGYNGNVVVLGNIVAPAGQIALQVEDPNKNPLLAAQDPGLISNQRIELGPDATLAAPAYANINTLNTLGLREGSVLTGGTISLQAYKGFVVTDPGSVIDVNGVATLLTLPSVNGNTPTLVAGNAGTINIGAREGIVLQGALDGQQASFNGQPVVGAAGGTLSVQLGLGFDAAAIIAANSQAPTHYPTTTRVLTLSSEPQAQQINVLQSGAANLSAPAIESGGFANIALSSADTIAFSGPVALQAAASLTLDAPLMMGEAGSKVSLAAPYVALGNYNNNPDYFGSAPGCTSCGSPNAAAVLTPSSGSASLNVTAQLIDLRGISGWSGFATETLVSSGDIRVVAGQNPVDNPPPSLNVTLNPIFAASAVATDNIVYEGAFNTSATLNLEVAQLYPTTTSSFAINDLPSNGTTASGATTVSISSSAPAGAAAPAIPFSAGGTLSINANQINQNGVVRAPLGQIALNGIDVTSQGAVVSPGSVTLADGSITSVAAGSLVIPYGSTLNGTQWTYSPAPGLVDVVDAPPAKQVSLTGASLTVNKGAQVDLSGGGDLYAYEFVAGQGGSVDVLNQASVATRAPQTTVYSYAILPTLGTQFAPVDPQYAQNSVVASNQTIYLSGVPGIPAGTYALLPADYALLPGAYAIQVIKANSGIAPGSVITQPGGGYEAAARFGVAGTDILSSLTSTVLVASDTTVRTQSQYTDSYANAFFNSQAVASSTVAPALPADAGQLLLSATDSLTLNGVVSLAVGSFTSGTAANGSPITQQGRGGDVAITAQNIVVVDSSTNQPPASGTLQLNVQQLDNLDAQTLILGASATTTASGEQLSLANAQGSETQSVELKNTTALSAPNVILVAQNAVTVDANAAVASNGSADTTAQTPTLLLPGGGALLRVSSSGPVALSVDPNSLPATPTGLVTIGAGATVQGQGSLLLYGSANTTLASGAQVGAPAVSLYSSSVSLGDAPAGTSGLVLTAQLVDSLKGLTDLTIGSTSTINLYGPIALGTAGSSSPTLNSINLDAAGIAGYGAGDKVLQAGNISWVNSSGSATNVTGDGSGALQLIATNASGSGQLTLGAGSKSVTGFSALNLQADGDIVGQGTGTLSVNSTAAVPVNMIASALIGTAQSSQSITTAGAVTISNSTSSAKSPLPSPGAGAQLTIEGSSIAQNGTIELPSGVVSLVANAGDVTLGAASVTAAPGAMQGYTATHAVAPGGQINLTASGNVTIDSGATVDVSGASIGGVNGDSGALNVAAPSGVFAFAGGILKGAAAAGQNQGSFTLDVGSGLAGTGPTSFTALNSLLNAGGFTGAIDLRTRGDTGVVSISDTVTASSFQLTADQGSIAVTSTGVINTSGSSTLIPNGGAISLFAGNGLTLQGGAQLLANASSSGPVGTNGAPLPSHGGDIALGTTNGMITIDGGSAAQPTVISMQGIGGADSDGQLTLRAPRTADDAGVQIQITDAPSLTLLTSKPLVVEGFKVYNATTLGAADTANQCAGTCDVADLTGALFTQAQTFVGNTANIVASNLGGLTNVEVRPGIEVDSAGDLTLASTWDLASWNAALGVPVNLTLRAAGNLIFNASVSDGFTSNGKAVATWQFGEPGTAADSASYTLAAGADLSSANPLAVIAQSLPAFDLNAAANAGNAAPNSGNFVLSPGSLIRTGTGNIQVAAGGDLLIGYNAVDTNGTLQITEVDPLSSAIYTAGTPSALSAAQSGQFTPPALTAVLTAGGGQVSYPTDGGNISISAAGDIRSAPSAELITDWLWRFVPTTGNSTWWVMFNDFTQGIGALGGGNLTLSAGRNVVDTSAVIPTTGRLLSPGTLLTTDLVLTGGGSLRVQAGNDIVSGVFEDDWGNASITAGGALTSSADSTFGQETAANLKTGAPAGFPSPTSQIYPVLATGNGVFSVDAGADIGLQGVTTSTTLPMIMANNRLIAQLGGDNAFYAYAQDANPSTLALTSAGGNVVLNISDPSQLPIAQLANAEPTLVYEKALNQNYFAVYPSTFDATSISGNIDLGTPKNGALDVTLFPSSLGDLKLLAQGSINNNGLPFAITQSEAAPTAVPTLLVPAPELNFPGVAGASLPQQPLHQNDPQPNLIVANTGNVESGTLNFPKQADVIAGGNVTDLTLNGKNLNPSDVTLVSAGGSIDYSTPTAPITNALEANSGVIQVAGPGFVEVLAGNSINLGDSSGVLTSGSLSDTRLITTGASLIAGAGWGVGSTGGLRQPADQAFINAYLAPNAAGAPGAYASALVAYMQQLYPGTAGASYASALSSFEALTPAQQLPLLAQVLSDELSATGLAHTLQGASYARGYTAINTLFPTTANGAALTYDGNINMVFSQLKTEQGGDIDLLVPGGSVIVGQANPPPTLNLIKESKNANQSITPDAVNLGILVLSQGNVQGFADQDFTVNQSRILTLEGGNIILWASNGNIDAGKGAKSASAAPPPVIETDQNGNLFVNPGNAVSGSGIGELLTNPDIKPGLVNLIAPNGAVNAGDAGIRVAGNLNIAAAQVIGASNITVAGTATGVPTSSAGAFAGALSGANSLGDASKNAVDQITQGLDSAQNFQQLTDSLVPTFINVKLFCLGVECETN